MKGARETLYFGREKHNRSQHDGTSFRKWRWLIQDCDNFAGVQVFSGQSSILSINNNCTDLIAHSLYSETSRGIYFLSNSLET